MKVSSGTLGRAVALCLTTTLAGLTAAGCGSSEPGASSTGSSSQSEGTKLVSLTAPAKCDASPTTEEMLSFKAPQAKSRYQITLMEVSLAGYPFQALAYGATEAAKDAGVDLDIVASQGGYGTVAQQLTLAENVLAKDPDGIVFTPADVDGSVGVVDMAAAKGVPTVVTFSEVNTTKALSVNQDDFLHGETAARMVGDYAEAGPGIVQGGPSNATWAVRRTNGFKAGVEKQPNLEIGTVTNSQLDPGEGLSKFTNATRRTPNPKWVYAVSNQLLPPDSVPREYKGKIFYLGGGFDPTTIAALENGSLKAAMAEVPIWQGYMSVSRMVSKLNGDTTPNRTCLPNPVLTKEDIGTPVATAANIKPESFVVE